MLFSSVLRKKRGFGAVLILSSCRVVDREIFLACCQAAEYSGRPKLFNTRFVCQ